MLDQRERFCEFLWRDIASREEQTSGDKSEDSLVSGGCSGLGWQKKNLLARVNVVRASTAEAKSGLSSTMLSVRI